ncbi:ABC-2 family transporter protein [Gracilibacillus ureilyticus]|uniref:ABC-2 family transporter protein n=1 Tax=Gracilibacillus ureilyticus TaxID=531814 RepID=A0A1H9NAB6_9BACI|nr:ABC-2 transporter permease [Gracilibacillus ureilyticus]SER32343.1 ABC-2 family transporter protein [Gracilibacillus ureilyticus]
MYNLVMKDLKLGINPWFLAMPFLIGALMFIPGWIYLLVLQYFFWISVPNIFGQFKAQNDLMLTMTLPVSRKDKVKPRIIVIVILELLHIFVAMIFSLFTIRLYPNVDYFFFAPYMGFWGICFVMLAIFNIIFIPMYYKTAYKYGAALIASVVATLLFSGVVQWLGIQNNFVFDTFNGSGADDTTLQLFILLAGITIFAVFTIVAYNIAIKRFEKVDI